MPRVDSAIAQSANQLRLRDLGDRLLEIYGRLAQSGTVLTDLEKTAQSLRSLHEALRSEIADHNAWQRIDNEIRLLEQTLRRPIPEIALGWRQLKRSLIDQIAKSPGTIWADQLNEAITSMDADLGVQNVHQLGVQFVEIRQITEEQFDRADNKLLEDCGKLRPIANGINLLLGGL
jgi:hypothetical protein